MLQLEGVQIERIPVLECDTPAKANVAAGNIMAAIGKLRAAR